MEGKGFSEKLVAGLTSALLMALFFDQGKYLEGVIAVGIVLLLARHLETIMQLLIAGSMVLVALVALSSFREWWQSNGPILHRSSQPGGMEPGFPALVAPRGAEQIVYCARVGSGYDYDLILLDLKSMNRVTLTRNADVDPGPTWSPDGSQLIFVSRPANYSQLYVLSLIDGSLHAITHSPYNKHQPSWSPNGRYVVYSIEKPDGDMDLLIWDFHQSRELQLTNYPGLVEIWGAKWSPEGKTIAFYSNLTFFGQHFETYLLEFPPEDIPYTNPGDLHVWSTDPASGADDDEQFVWSPDCKKFAFINKPDIANLRYFEILIGEFDSGGAVALGEWPMKTGSLYGIPDAEQVFEAAPAWSPDSTKVAFHRVSSGKDPYVGEKDIFVFDLPTGVLHNITNTPDIDDRWPAWRPVQQ